MIQIPGYQIVREISSGGMGTVLDAFQVNAGNRRVAIKMIRADHGADPAFRKRFISEANCAILEHPNIVRILDVRDEAGQLFIVMEYLSGGDLAARIRAGMSPRDALAVVRQLAGALGHAHSRGLIHRDVKAANVLFRADGAAVLTDFGIAKFRARDETITESGAVVGSPFYMSPEQAQAKSVDARSDLYSVGVLFYEMLVGSRPFAADRALAVLHMHIYDPVPPLPENLKAYQPLINRLMAKDPSDRFESAEVLVAAVDRLLATSSTPEVDLSQPAVDTPPAATLTQDVRRQRQFRRALFAAGSIGAAVVLALLSQVIPVPFSVGGKGDDPGNSEGKVISDVVDIENGSSGKNGRSLDTESPPSLSQGDKNDPKPRKKENFSF